ncbi:MAG: hypothetical protein JSU82_14815 [Rhodospirillales bacterium]|nr:MAG: hypothetical protein JSU82_14815 [Rhodospirillales bacterium]
MEQLIGNSLAVFIGLTCVIAGGAAWMTGQALAATWRPVWQAVAYALLLALADRFLIFALFEGELLSLAGFALDGAVLVVIALAGHRITLAAQMVKQYPWLYERRGLLSWRPRNAVAAGADQD